MYHLPVNRAGENTGRKNERRMRDKEKKKISFLFFPRGKLGKISVRNRGRIRETCDLSSERAGGKVRRARTSRRAP